METVALAGRIVFGLFFLFNGINHFAQLQGMTAYARVMNTPAPALAVVVTGAMLALGGLSFLFQYQVVVGAWLLTVFLVLAAFWFHAFWRLTDPVQRANQMAHFLKNLALAGAALALAV
jgi:uncharacterized membrane protein YphA (DoxX/SURF4 family)